MTNYDLAAQRRHAHDVVAQLRAAGFTAYFAGGCVRDELLGRVPKDYDVATSARPEQIRAVFGTRKTLAIGEAFGVIAVLGPKSAGMVEATTFRRDGGYSDGRRPDAVEFTDAEEDARRRDFTMNALFFDPLEQRVIDYVGGRADIERRLVRAVGDARARFAEDKLRMLRAVRMASRFGFDLDPATAAAVRDAAHEVTIVSPERIAQEMRAMLGKPGQAMAVRLLKETNLLQAILPELGSADDLNGRETLEVTLLMLARLDESSSPSFALGLAALLHLLDGPDPVATIAQRWRLSNAERDDAKWLITQSHKLMGSANKPWSEVQPLLVDSRAPLLIEFFAVEIPIFSVTADDIAFCRRKLALPRAELDPPPLVSGNDLIAAGLKPGRAFTGLIAKLRAAQLDGVIRSTAEGIELAKRSLDE